MKKSEKQSLRVEVAEMFSKATGAIVAEFSGLTVEEITELRRLVRGANGQFKVAKNRIVKKALDIDVKSHSAIAPNLKGPIGIAFFYKDAAAGAKILFKFESEHQNFKVKSGLVGLEVFEKAGLKTISDLPSKEVLLSKILGSISAPHRGLVTVMSGVSRNLVQVINAIKDKKTS